MRYLPLTEADRRAMLAKIGVPSVDSLFRDVPKSAWLDKPVDLPPHQGELEVERAITALARKNLGTGAAESFLGAGAQSAFISPPFRCLTVSMLLRASSARIRDDTPSPVPIAHAASLIGTSAAISTRISDE